MPLWPYKQEQQANHNFLHNTLWWSACHQNTASYENFLFLVCTFILTLICLVIWNAVALLCLCAVPVSRPPSPGRLHTKHTLLCLPVYNWHTARNLRNWHHTGLFGGGRTSIFLKVDELYPGSVVLMPQQHQWKTLVVESNMFLFTVFLCSAVACVSSRRGCWQTASL